MIACQEIIYVMDIVSAKMANAISFVSISVIIKKQDIKLIVIFCT